MDIPQILVIDDLFGRTVPNGTNIQRANLCGQYLIKDITGDETSVESAQQIRKPVAEAFFCRGQSPSCSEIGMVVENDLNATLATIRSGWSDSERKFKWALVLLDLCFYTGKVTKESSSRYIGMP